MPKLALTKRRANLSPDCPDQVAERDTDPVPFWDNSWTTAECGTGRTFTVGSMLRFPDQVIDGVVAVEIGQETANAAMAATAEVETRARISAN